MQARVSRVLRPRRGPSVLRVLQATWPLQARGAARLPSQHKEYNLFFSFLLFGTGGAALLAWVVKSEMYGGDSANPGFDPVMLREELEEYFKAHPKAVPAAVNLVWTSNLDFRYRQADRRGCTGHIPDHPVFTDVTRSLVGALAELQQHYEISTPDLWAFAGCVALQVARGPIIPFKYGRSTDDTTVRPALDDPCLDAHATGDLELDELRKVFYRKGLNDLELVALMGAHCLRQSNVFSNSYYRELLKEKSDVPLLPADRLLLRDPLLRYWVEVFARDRDEFFIQYSSAYSKVCGFNHAPWGPVLY